MRKALDYKQTLGFFDFPEESLRGGLSNRFFYVFQIIIKGFLRL